MSNGLSSAGQGPMAGEAEVATEAREVNLTAVQEDLNGMQEQLAILDQTVQRLQEHLMGAQPTLKSEGLEKADRPSPSGKLPILCMLGSNNLRHLHRIQERLNQLCYELGEGK